MIVAMWWGRPHELIVEGRDKEGEPCVSEVITIGPPDPERRTFTCHVDNWKAALLLGRVFAWQPKASLTTITPSWR